MAHELEADAVSGKIPMFYAGKLPWHGLGQSLEGGRPATAAEAIQLAQLGWEAQKYGAYAFVGGKYVQIPDTYAVVREDTVGLENPVVLTRGGKTVSSQYVPFQNASAFEFFDSVVGEGKAVYHTAGALRGGERVWILAKLPDTLSILGVDDVETYVLMVNSHNGSSAIQTMLTTVRVVCANTLRLALSSGLREVKIRHSANAKEKIQEAARLMGIVTKEVKEVEQVFTKMASTPFSSFQAQGFFNTLYPAPLPGEDGKVSERARTNYEKRLASLTDIFARGSGADLATTRGTLFGAFNAVTDYVDHFGRAVKPDVHMESVLFGHGDGLKQAAMQLAISLIAA